MSELNERLRSYEEVLRRLAAVLRSARLYAPTHQRVTDGADELLRALRLTHATRRSITLGFIGDEVVVDDITLPRAGANLTDLIRQLHTTGIEQIEIAAGVTKDELVAFVQAITRRTYAPSSAPVDGSAEAADEGVDMIALPHIRGGRLWMARGGDDSADPLAQARRVYARAVSMAELVWESTMAEGIPELATAREAVETLAQALSRSRTTLIGLTALRKHDRYTFSHMVNVSILTMAQAAALGIKGRLLYEIGLAALMHDIGKVQTPGEILNKPEKLTAGEFVVMRRHTIDGAHILRRTPDIPALAPVVAFEHHLRLDGSGYPESASRPSLNLATMLCAIADVYDAMRSQRAYQQAFPSARILAVLKQNDGVQFDRHLVRRFVQIVGIYPPGSLVRLATGEIAVVIRVHAPDPYRPAVRILFSSDGARLSTPEERNLWELDPDCPDATRVVTPLDSNEAHEGTLSYLAGESFPPSSRPDYPACPAIVNRSMIDLSPPSAIANRQFDR